MSLAAYSIQIAFLFCVSGRIRVTFFFFFKEEVQCMKEPFNFTLERYCGSHQIELGLCWAISNVPIEEGKKTNLEALKRLYFNNWFHAKKSLDQKSMSSIFLSAECSYLKPCAFVIPVWSCVWRPASLFPLEQQESRISASHSVSAIKFHFALFLKLRVTSAMILVFSLLYTMFCQKGCMTEQQTESLFLLF